MSFPLSIQRNLNNKNTSLELTQNSIDTGIHEEKSEEYVKFDHEAAEQLPYLKGRFRYELEKYYRDRYGPYLPKE